MSDAAQTSISALQRALDAVRAGELQPAAFVQQARPHPALLLALPRRYATVWDELHDRLEASALFTEESCSFSQTDLLDAMQAWITQARQALG